MQSPFFSNTCHVHTQYVNSSHNRLEYHKDAMFTYHLCVHYEYTFHFKHTAIFILVFLWKETVDKGWSNITSMYAQQSSHIIFQLMLLVWKAYQHRRFVVQLV